MALSATLRGAAGNREVFLINNHLAHHAALYKGRGIVQMLQSVFLQSWLYEIVRRDLKTFINKWYSQWGRLSIKKASLRKKSTLFLFIETYQLYYLSIRRGGFNMRGNHISPPECYVELTTYLTETQHKFYRLAFSYVRNKEDALDIVQNAICKALENYQSLKNKEAVKTWFYRILVNESMAFLKKRREELLPDEQIIDLTPYYEKKYELYDDPYEQINALPRDVQTVIKLRYYEEFSLKEIAAVTGMNLSTVKTKLYRGLKMLKQRMEAEA